MDTFQGYCSYTWTFTVSTELYYRRIISSFVSFAKVSSLELQWPRKLKGTFLVKSKFYCGFSSTPMPSVWFVVQKWSYGHCGFRLFGLVGFHILLLYQSNHTVLSKQGAWRWSRWLKRCHWILFVHLIPSCKGTSSVCISCLKWLLQLAYIRNIRTVYTLPQHGEISTNPSWNRKQHCTISMPLFGIQSNHCLYHYISLSTLI